jgi:hypothetical protein
MAHINQGMVFQTGGWTGGLVALNHKNLYVTNSRKNVNWTYNLESYEYN